MNGAQRRWLVDVSVGLGGLRPLGESRQCQGLTLLSTLPSLFTEHDCFVVTAGWAAGAGVLTDLERKSSGKE